MLWVCLSASDAEHVSSPTCTSAIICVGSKTKCVVLEMQAYGVCRIGCSIVVRIENNEA